MQKSVELRKIGSPSETVTQPSSGLNFFTFLNAVNVKIKRKESHLLDLIFFVHHRKTNSYSAGILFILRGLLISFLPCCKSSRSIFFIRFQILRFFIFI